MCIWVIWFNYSKDYDKNKAYQHVRLSSSKNNTPIFYAPTCDSAGPPCCEVPMNDGPPKEKTCQDETINFMLPFFVSKNL